jgi:subtilisin family serine protease
MLVAAPSNGGNKGITTCDLMGIYGYNKLPGAAGDCTDSFGGTSSAAPLVAGVVALVLGANRNLGWKDVQLILLSTASKVDPLDSDWTQNGAGRWVNHKYGFGLVNARF